MWILIYLYRGVSLVRNPARRELSICVPHPHMYELIITDRADDLVSNLAFEDN